MKTKFFKKLSFVLVVAMVLSLLVPATGAFAASAKLNSTKKYLHLGREESGENEFNFNIKNKKSGWKYSWESLDEDVVEVNAKNGVATATGVGKTKVNVIITDANDEEVADLSATVTVRDNIEEVTISNKVEKLAVGEEHDYNRSYVTESGSTKKTSSITRWTVTPEGATIDEKGNFLATVAGEFTVTALSFQSKAKYNAWVDAPEANAGEVLDTDETKVVVGASMVEAKQNDLDTITVTFDSAMVKADVEKNMKLSYVAGSTKVNHQIKEVKMDDTGLVATVDLYGNLIKNSTYVVDFDGMDSKEFTSAKVEYKDVVRAEILTKTAQIAVEEEIKYALYDVNGVDIGAAFAERVVLESTGLSSYLDVASKKLTMFKVGEPATIKLTYHTYDYDLTSNTEIGAVTAEGVVNCVEKKTASTGMLNAYTAELLADGANWNTVKHSVAAGDIGRHLFVQLLGKNIDGSDKKTNSDGTVGLFKFTSSNENILIINDRTGQIYPVREGQAAVVVYYDDVYVGSAVVTVVGGRRATEITVSAQNFTLSNHTQVKDVKDVTVEVKDQLGTAYPSSSYSVTTKLVGRPGGDEGLRTSLEGAKGTSTDKITFNGAPGSTPAPVTAGNYTYAVEITDIANGNAKTTRYIYVNVALPSQLTGTPHHYSLEADNTEYDTKVTDTDPDVVATISLFGYATNGVRMERVTLDASAGYTVTVKDAKNTSHTIGSTDGLSYVGGNIVLPLVDRPTVANAPGTVLKAKPTGTYVLTAINASGKAANATYFTVKNTQDTASLVINKFQTDKVDLVQAVNDCFDVKVGGSTVDVTNALHITSRSVATDSIFIDKVKVYVAVGSFYVEYEVSVGTVIRINQ